MLARRLALPRAAAALRVSAAPARSAHALHAAAFAARKDLDRETGKEREDKERGTEREQERGTEKNKDKEKEKEKEERVSLAKRPWKAEVVVDVAASGRNGNGDGVVFADGDGILPANAAPLTRAELSTLQRGQRQRERGRERE